MLYVETTRTQTHTHKCGLLMNVSENKADKNAWPNLDFKERIRNGLLCCLTACLMTLHTQHMYSAYFCILVVYQKEPCISTCKQMDTFV